MKKWKIKANGFGSQKSCLFVLGTTFLILTFSSGFETSKTETDSLVLKRDSRVFLNSFRSFRAEQVQQETQESTSVWSKIFGGIGKFFSVIGIGFATGVTETVKFLGWVIALPVTGTMALFGRTHSDSVSTGTESARK